MSRKSNAKPVGRVAGLWRYPVKSMRGEALVESALSWHGLPGDRRWAFIRENAVANGFPWLTLRERSDMSQYAPSFTNRSKPDTSPTVVETPSGAVLDIADPKLAAELGQAEMRVIRQSRGVFDTFPVSLITTQTISKLSEIVGDQLDVQRFRPNILIDITDGTAFAEDSWVGHVLRIGDARLRIDQRDGRCVVITIDPVTGKRNPGILKAVAEERQGCLGVYGTTVDPGQVAENDTVFLEPLA